MLADYRERLRRLVACSIVELPDLSKRRGLQGVELKAAEAREITQSLCAGSRKVFLDERGRQMSSAGFASWFESERNRGTREIEFVLGGPEGLDSGVLELADMVLSLGEMTWTHEMCRVLLLEQIYRAHCILRNIPYHK